MAFQDIKQPDIINVDEVLRLRKLNECEYSRALPWYENPLILYLSEGITDNRVYDINIIQRMYSYLGGIGELYFIEIFEDNEWRPVGDVTLSEENMPIVIGEPGYWSSGIGRRVISKLLERAREIGIKKIHIPSIYKYNERSGRLFTSLGFVKVSEDEGAYSFELEL